MAYCIALTLATSDSWMRFSRTVCNINEHPDADSTCVSQGLYGERVDVVQREGAYASIRCCRDNYEGYVDADSLVECAGSTTHVVTERATLLFSRPDIKSRIKRRALYGAELTVLNQYDERFFRCDDGSFALANHVRTAGQHETTDLIDLAQRFFIGAPYVWGGRSPDGCDCSGLLQMVAFGLGISVPRDSEQQESFIERQVNFNEITRNDLLFWPGHVAIALNAKQVLHATAHTMLTCIEPLSDVMDRAGPVSSVRRL